MTDLSRHDNIASLLQYRHTVNIFFNIFFKIYFLITLLRRIAPECSISSQKSELAADAGVPKYSGKRFFVPEYSFSKPGTPTIVIARPAGPRQSSIPSFPGRVASFRVRPRNLLENRHCEARRAAAILHTRLFPANQPILSFANPPIP
jgi:hypothetical protein